eukprot:Phypoly_transcript_10971.p1 GENE.Phypoly_transcript_10971~~Phypoly_transcript_10971.p1  ORF type:complete len:378 (+),score=59.01 Phypoly_transcript_10971:104-1237(+)
MKSSFTRKAPVKRQCPPGTKLSVHNGQLLVSSGLHDFDEILGGGLAVGTVLLLEEDANTTHYQLLTKFFLAEGAGCGHSVMVASVGEKEDAGEKGLVAELPSVHVSQADAEKEKQEESAEKKEEGSADLKIAWRYKNLTQQKGNADVFCHHFDFAHRLPLETMVDASKLHLLYLSPSPGAVENHYAELFAKISELVHQYNSQNRQAGSNVDKISILRIVIHSFASPLWAGEESDALKFMHALRGLLRSSLAVCMITFPTHLHPPALAQKIRHLSDYAVAMVSFAGSRAKVPPAFTDYKGFFYIHKIPRINSLVPPVWQDTHTLGFKLKRYKLIIEKINLPPEEGRAGDSAEQTHQHKNQPVSSLLCTPGTKPSPIDF